MDIEPTDQILVQQTLADAEQYRHIIDRYRAKLLRYVGHLGVKDRSHQEDILQEVFIKVYRNLNAYSDDFPFSSWIYRITHNEAMTFFRKKKIAPLSLESFADVPLIPVEETDDAKIVSDEQLKTLVNTLDQKYKEVIVLKYFEEKSYDEIADILQKPPGTIATLLNRAKQKLKSLIQELGNE
jgi:RNA polymerase sigma-70 factor (ECF subfamily)